MQQHKSIYALYWKKYCGIHVSLVLYLAASLFTVLVQERQFFKDFLF